MNSNVNQKNKANAVPDKQKRPSTPPCKSLRSEILSTPQTSKGPRSATKKSLEKTPRKPKHNASKSCQDEEKSLQFSSPCKSRLDFSAIPTPSVDYKSCLEDINRYKTQQKKDMLAEKKLMTEEWVKARQKIKDDEMKDILKHEEQLTLEKVEFNRIIKEKEKSIKIQEQQDKINDFFALKEARKVLKDAEKVKELDYIKIEREKSLKKQRELDEKREKTRKEREEKRNSFLESVVAAKKMQDEESIRLKKELEFEQAQEILGLRDLTYQNSIYQKTSLEKAGVIFSN